MSPKVQALLLLVGLITFLAVHAEEELSEIEESERECVEEHKSCNWDDKQCCPKMSCHCSIGLTNCKCVKGPIRKIIEWIIGK
uniref:U5-Lycotoxin-Lsp1i_1 n=1 Tax=Lycosa sp. SGP-2016 TaxID=1905177 RepID=A0A482ZI99_9ARAC